MIDIHIVLCSINLRNQTWIQFFFSNWRIWFPIPITRAHLRVAELESGDGEHDLPGRDDEVLRHDPQHVDGVLRREDEVVDVGLVVAVVAVAPHVEGAHAALANRVAAQLRVADVQAGG